MVEFQITTQKLPNRTATISISGHLDTETTPQLEKAFQQLYDQGINKFIFDLSALNYVSSAGLGLFTKFLAMARSAQGDIVLVQAKPEVKEMLGMVGLDQIIKITPDQTTALKTLKQSG